MSQGWLFQKIKYVILLSKNKVTTQRDTNTHTQLKEPGDKIKSLLFKNWVQQQQGYSAEFLTPKR